MQRASWLQLSYRTSRSSSHPYHIYEVGSISRSWKLEFGCKGWNQREFMLRFCRPPRRKSVFVVARFGLTQMRGPQSEHNYTQHLLTITALDSLIPVTTISGISRMVPNDAVLRWPRLYCGCAANTHTHTQPQTQACRCRLRQTTTDSKRQLCTCRAYHTLCMQGQHAHQAPDSRAVSNYSAAFSTTLHQC